MTRTIRMKDIAGLKANTTTAPYATTEPAKIGGVRVPPPTENPGWQTELEANFMLADSFDDTEDWNPQTIGNYEFGSPTRLNGAPSIWGRYSSSRAALGVNNKTGPLPVTGDLTFSNGKTGSIYRAFTEKNQDYLCVDLGGNSGPIPVGTIVTSGAWSATVNYLPKWIGNEHPVYRNRGKSLCINYNNFSGGIDGFGPARMTTFFGEQGNSLSGYKKIHVFWMMHIDPAFYVQNPDGTFPPTGVQKLFDLCSGMQGVNDWGSAAEKSITENTDQNYKEYGLNNTIVNISGGGTHANRLYLRDNSYRAEQTPESLWRKDEWTPVGGVTMSDPAITGQDCDIQDPYLNKEWFGIEVALDIGTLNTADGSIETWIYDQNGAQLGSWSKSGDMRKVQFDHLYNMFTMGGNRLCDGYGMCDPDAHSRFYVDDFIINQTKIGPSYFNLLTQFEAV